MNAQDIRAAFAAIEKNAKAAKEHKGAIRDELHSRISKAHADASMPADSPVDIDSMGGYLVEFVEVWESEQTARLDGWSGEGKRPKTTKLQNAVSAAIRAATDPKAIARANARREKANGEIAKLIEKLTQIGATVPPELTTQCAVPTCDHVSINADGELELVTVEAKNGEKECTKFAEVIPQLAVNGDTLDALVTLMEVTLPAKINQLRELIREQAEGVAA